MSTQLKTNLVTSHECQNPGLFMKNTDWVLHKILMKSKEHVED